MLSSVAKEVGVWLIGGIVLELFFDHPIHFATGSIPEREESTGNIYNTCTVYSPKGKCLNIVL
jgi:omega-amidase